MTALGSIVGGVETWLAGHDERVLTRSVECRRGPTDLITRKTHKVCLFANEFLPESIKGYGEGRSYEEALGVAWVKLSEALGAQRKRLC